MSKLARLAWLAIPCCCFLGLGVSAESASPEGLMVNVYRGEINGVHFSTMTPDMIRRTLGPPSAVEPPESQQENQRISISYHALGLFFALHRPNGQTPLQCWQVGIYLTKTWDQKTDMFFLPFPGRLSKQVNHAWSVQQIATEFRHWYPRPASQEHVAVLLNALQITQAAPADYQGLSIEESDFRIDFLYHQTERLLQAISLTLPSSVHPERPAKK